MTICQYSACLHKAVCRCKWGQQSMRSYAANIRCWQQLCLVLSRLDGVGTLFASPFRDTKSTRGPCSRRHHESEATGGYAAERAMRCTCQSSAAGCISSSPSHIWLWLGFPNCCLLIDSFWCRDMTRPPVIKEAGSIIQPIQFNKSYADQSQERGPVSQRRKTAVIAGGVPAKGQR